MFDLQRLLIPFTALVLFACGPQPDATKTEEAKPKLPKYHYTIFKLRDGWGYDVYRNDSLKVHQTVIPNATDTSYIPSFEMADSLAEAKVEAFTLADKK